MSSSQAMDPVNRPASDAADPGRRSDEKGGVPGGEAAGDHGGEAAGDHGGEAAGDHGGEAAGGLGHETGPDRIRAPGRGLGAYLLVPRPDSWAKAQIAPACFLLAASGTGRFGNWEHFLVLWLVLEGLIYAARYQWNDIRGIEGDQQHAEAQARSRLPVGTTAQTRLRSIRLSWAAVALRISAALLIGALTGLVGQILVLTGAVFVVAVAYEFLRGLAARRSPLPARAQAIAVWLVVGLGYLIRGGLGLGVAGLTWGSLTMASGLACVTSFGIMFVLLTWVLDASSYCDVDASGGWHARADLAAKPHLAALLRSVGRPLLSGSVPSGQGRYGGAERALGNGGSLSAPWNLALLAAAASGAVLGVGLSRPRAGGPGLYLAATLVSVIGAVLLARCRSSPGRWVTTAAASAALIGAAYLARPALPVLVGLPWLAIASIYSAFHGWSYRDLVAAAPRLAAVRKATGAGIVRLVLDVRRRQSRHGAPGLPVTEERAPASARSRGPCSGRRAPPCRRSGHAGTCGPAWSA